MNCHRNMNPGFSSQYGKDTPIKDHQKNEENLS